MGDKVARTNSADRSTQVPELQAGSQVQLASVTEQPAEAEKHSFTEAPGQPVSSKVQPAPTDERTATQHDGERGDGGTGHAVIQSSASTGASPAMPLSAAALSSDPTRLPVSSMSSAATDLKHHSKSTILGLPTTQEQSETHPRSPVEAAEEIISLLKLLTAPASPPRRKIETIKDWVSAVNGLIVAGGIIFTAVWSYRLLVVTRQVQMAETNLAKLQAETSMAEKISNRKKVILPDITAQAIYAKFKQDAKSLEKTTNRYIQAELILKNSGVDNVDIDIKKSDMQFYACQILSIPREQGRITCKNIYNLNLEYHDFKPGNLIIKAGSEPSIFRSITEVTEPGLYLIRFRVDAPESESDPQKSEKDQTKLSVSKDNVTDPTTPEVLTAERFLMVD